MSPKNPNSVTTETSGAVVAAKSKVPTKIIWSYVLGYLILHIASIYGLYLAITSAMWKTLLFGLWLDILCGFGITCGCHRLWAHRSFKAKLPLRIYLALLHSMAYQSDIYTWVRDHRVHHKYSETDADPYNAKRGFFFSHIGWLMVRKHPDVAQKGKGVDMSDVIADPVVRFQRKFYVPLAVLLCFVLPTITPMILWGESFRNAFFVPTILRYVAVLNQTFLVNSAAHMWGNRPYDKYINPAENSWVTFATYGEGYHNYHHSFPWDYAASENGFILNLNTQMINISAWLGLAYDLRTASPKTIRERKMRTGEDG